MMVDSRTPIDPVEYVGRQLDHMSDRIEQMEATLRDVEVAIEDLRSQRVSDVAAGCEHVLDKLRKDSDFGRLHYNVAADHMGRRWYDNFRLTVGGWLIVLFAGTAGVASLVWYVSTIRGAP